MYFYFLLIYFLCVSFKKDSTVNVRHEVWLTIRLIKIQIHCVYDCATSKGTNMKIINSLISRGFLIGVQRAYKTDETDETDESKLSWGFGLGIISLACQG